jgi:type II secretory pathway pseudopilin PulG
MKKITSQQKGYSLIEMIVYVTLISVIFLLIVNTLLSFSSSYRQLEANRLLEHTAIDTLERLSRDIRNANTITVNGTGDITLTQSTGSISTTTRIYLQSGDVKLDINGTYFGPLCVRNSQVTNLTFTLATSSEANAVKIDMTVQASSGSVIRTKQFHSTVIAKES